MQKLSGMKPPTGTQAWARSHWVLRWEVALSLAPHVLAAYATAPLLMAVFWCEIFAEREPTHSNTSGGTGRPTCPSLAAELRG